MEWGFVKLKAPSGLIDAVKAAGATLSITKLNAGENEDSPLITSLKVERIVCDPFAIGADGVIVYVPPLQTCVGKIAVPSTYRVTVSPVTQVPVKSGVVSLVMLSVLDEPVSVPDVMSGATVGAGVA